MTGKIRRPPPERDQPASQQAEDGGVAAGHGNAFAQMLLQQHQAGEGGSEGLGLGDSLAALRGELHLSRLLPDDVQAEFAQGDDEANEIDYDKAWLGGNDSLTIDRVRMNRLSAGGVSAADVQADGIRLDERDAARGNDAARLTIPTASAKEIKGEGFAVGEAAIEGVSAQREYAETDAGWSGGFFSTPGQTTASVDQVTLRGVQSDQGSAETVSGKGLTGQLDQGPSQDPQLTVGAAGLSATGLRGGGATIGEASVKGVSASAHATGPNSVATQATTEDISASAVQYAADGTAVSAGALSVAGLSASVGPDGQTDVEATGLTADEVKLRYQQAAGQGFGDTAILDELFDLVQSARVQGAVPLNAGKHGRGKGQVNVPRGAQAVVELTVAGNRIVPQRTSVDFTPDLGTVLWPKLTGIYITNSGRVFVDVRKSIFVKDQDLLELLGMGSNRALPLGLKDAANTLVSGGSGGGGSHDNLANMAGSRFTASASLAGAAQLGGADVRVGNADVSAAVEGGDRIGARITDLVLQSVGLDLGEASVQVDNVQSEQIDAQHGPGGGTVQSKKISADRAAAKL